MHSSILFIAALTASTLASPPNPVLNVNGGTPGGLQTVSDYFNLLAQTVQQSRLLSEAPDCDLSRAQMSQDTPTALPPPGAGLTLVHVAVGRGTQNYTCDTTNATAVPFQVGALATLFNASCLAANHPDLLNLMPAVALQFNMTPWNAAPAGAPAPVLSPSNLGFSGHHFFANATAPWFDLDTPQMQLGQLPCGKNGSAPAPASAPKGQVGDTAVPWLKLVAKPGASGGLSQVFRVATAGGSAPATCKGMPASFEVQYAAQYWFYKS